MDLTDEKGEWVGEMLAPEYLKKTRDSCWLLKKTRKTGIDLACNDNVNDNHNYFYEHIIAINWNINWSLIGSR